MSGPAEPLGCRWAQDATEQNECLQIWVEDRMSVCVRVADF
jgi:hypothetical protein